MAVEGPVGAVVGEDIAETLDESWQAFGRHRGVLDKRHRLAVARQSKHKRRRGIAQAPQPIAQRRLDRRQRGDQSRQALQPAVELVDAILHLGHVVAA